MSTQPSNVTEHIEYLRSKVDSSLHASVAVISNFIEEVSEENISLKKEKQELKNEVNRLNGEQGKPDIKGNKSGNLDFSSEKERKQAEEEAEVEEVTSYGFKFDKQSLSKLKESRLPADILNKLNGISGKKYSDEEIFIEAVTSVIGEKSTNQYHSLLIKYATYKKRNRKSKLPNIEIHRHEKCVVNKEDIPEDSVFKGCTSKVVQDIVITQDNVEFQREVYYSPILKRTYTGTIPKGYEGDFGPSINSSILSMKYVNGMSIPKIVEFYTNMGVQISSAYISTTLTKSKHIDVFHKEKSELYKAGLDTGSYTQIDETGTRVNGDNQYTNIVCNDKYTAFFTTKRKDRLTMLDVLRDFEAREFLLNDKTFSLLDQLRVSKSYQALLQDKKREKVYSEDEITNALNQIGELKNKPRVKSKIMEACAITAYRSETGISIVKILVSDDAPQFKLLTDELALCWIHEARHYKKLNPIIRSHQEELKVFLGRYWEYYRDLLKFKKNPSIEEFKKLSNNFDHLFSTRSAYEKLNNRVEKSKEKKVELLVALNHPEVPLHNNISENGARAEKRRMDVSLQTKTDEGTQAKDTMMSIVETCKKLHISGYKFIHDRISGEFKMPSLGDLIKTANRKWL
jgi:hypothetical protein